MIIYSVLEALICNLFALTSDNSFSSELETIKLVCVIRIHINRCVGNADRKIVNIN
jgi:hypothetical protein